MTDSENKLGNLQDEMLAPKWISDIFNAITALPDQVMYYLDRLSGDHDMSHIPEDTRLELNQILIEQKLMDVNGNIPPLVKIIMQATHQNLALEAAKQESNSGGPDSSLTHPEYIKVLEILIKQPNQGAALAVLHSEEVMDILNDRFNKLKQGMGPESNETITTIISFVKKVGLNESPIIKAIENNMMKYLDQKAAIYTEYQDTKGSEDYYYENRLSYRKDTMQLIDGILASLPEDPNTTSDSSELRDILGTYVAKVQKEIIEHEAELEAKKNPKGDDTPTPIA